MISTWDIPPLNGGSAGEELLLSFDRGRAVRVLILPAWFDEANKLRRFTVEVMRRLDHTGIDSFLPDFPGCNESLNPLIAQTLDNWRACASAAAETLGANHVLAIRAGALLAPARLPGLHYAPQSGPKLLRGMLRAQTISAREAGISITSETLLAKGRSDGITLGGWQFSARMINALETAEPAVAPEQRDIAQSQLGGAGLWLRAEPDDDAAQADALAAIIAGAVQ